MRSSRDIAVRIALVYAVAAGLWILISGWFAFSLPKPLEGYVETTKGLLFVATTSFLLYLVVGRWTAAAAEETRRAAEARRQLQQVVDTVPVGVVLLDAGSIVSFLNPAAERLLAVTRTQSVGRRFEDVLGAHTQPRFAATVGELLTIGSVDHLVLTSDEGISTRAVTARAAEIDPKTPGSGWIVALADSTSIHDELARSSRLLEGYRFLSEMAVLMGASYDARQLLRRVCELAVTTGGFKAAWASIEGDDGRLLEAGTVGITGKALEVVQRMRGATEERVDAMIPRFAEADVIIENHILDDPRSAWHDAALESGFGSLALFGIIDGGRLKAALTLFAESPGFFDTEERRLVTALKTDVGIAIDRISLQERRLEAEHALARSVEAYRDMFDANPQPMYVHDMEDMRFLAVNDAMIEKYGYTREQFKAMSIGDIRPSAEIPHLMQQLANRPQDVLFDAGFWTHRDCDGREFPVHVHTHTIDWQGQEAQLVMVEEVAKMA